MCLFEKFEERFAKNGEIFKLDQWLQYFAFDVMGTNDFLKAIWTSGYWERRWGNAERNCRLYEDRRTSDFHS